MNRLAQRPRQAPAPPAEPHGDTGTLWRVRESLLALADERRPTLLLVGEAWHRGYTAVPRDTGPHMAVVLTPRTGLETPEPGRIELVAADGRARWRWADTGELLAADPAAPSRVVDELDARLRPSLSAPPGVVYEL